jgi:hypothetical protein
LGCFLSGPSSPRGFTTHVGLKSTPPAHLHPFFFFFCLESPTSGSHCSAVYVLSIVAIWAPVVRTVSYPEIPSPIVTKPWQIRLCPVKRHRAVPLLAPINPGPPLANSITDHHERTPTPRAMAASREDKERTGAAASYFWPAPLPSCYTQIIKLIKELIFLCDLPSTFETCD